MSTSNGRRNNLDALRLGAALLVLVSHGWALLGLEEQDFVVCATRGGFSASWLGLGIFFSISGYLIDGSAASSRSWRDFTRRRLLRIWPGLAVVVLLLVFVAGPLLGTLPVAVYFTSIGTYLYLATLSLWGIRWRIPGMFEGNPVQEVNGSLWTLPYEATFYVLSWVLLRRTKGWKLPAMLFLLGLVLRIFAYPVVEAFPLRPLFLSFHHLLNFGLFYLAGTLVRRLSAHRRALWVAFAVVTLLWLASLGHESMRRPLDFLILPLGSILVGTSSIWPFNRLFRIGDLSYGVYIFGFPVQQTMVQFAGKENLSPTLLAFHASWISMLIAFASWHLVEKPSLELKDRPLRLGRWSL